MVHDFRSAWWKIRVYRRTIVSVSFRCRNTIAAGKLAPLKPRKCSCFNCTHADLREFDTIRLRILYKSGVIVLYRVSGSCILFSYETWHLLNKKHNTLVVFLVIVRDRRPKSTKAVDKCWKRFTFYMFMQKSRWKKMQISLTSGAR